jgi:hypothetical protein
MSTDPGEETSLSGKLAEVAALGISTRAGGTVRTRDEMWIKQYA